MTRSQILDIPTARVFKPLLEPARYKGAKGGRGSAKSHFFAGLMVEEHVRYPGFRSVCMREIQKDLKESAKMLIEDKISQHGLDRYFQIKHNEIGTPGGGLIIFRGMQEFNKDSIKSLEGFNRAWVEEAHTLTAGSLEMLRPTMRAKGSETWFSWNPRSATDAVEEFFASDPPNSVVVKANWKDNPWFPAELDADRKYDFRANLHRYAHIWDGEYEPSVVGAIWDRATINACRRDHPETLRRILVAIDPAVSSEPGSDEHGIIVVGEGEDGRGYVLEDASMKGAPRQWAMRALAMVDKWDADAIVIERNQGGDMCKHTILSARPTVRVIDVVATRGKHVRAEPISALYSGGQISHSGAFPQLEAQMCQITAAGYEGDGSPDRADALVWGLTKLFPPMALRKRKDRTADGARGVHSGSDGGWMA